MKIVIAPDSFKESLSAFDVACAIEQGFREIYPQAQYIKLPMADGGEGTVEAMVAATGGKRVELPVTGPLGETVNAFYGWLSESRTAVIEMAAASGLHLVPPELRDPFLTSSVGTGELILAALEQGAQQIILGIGGSATNDGGAGMMQALGARLLDRHGEPLPPGGAALADLTTIDLSNLDQRLAEITLRVACDVDNPLCGPKGASAVFGPQKGASPEQVVVLDNALLRWGRQIEQISGYSVLELPGAGAAGGLGAALAGLLNAQLEPGIAIVTDALQLATVVQGADLVITGEGRIDSQTVRGKTPIGVAKIAKQFAVPTIALAGGVARDHALVHQHGLDAVFAIVNRIVTLPEALADAEENLRVTARNIAALWRIAQHARD
ncbi:glycerate kinase [Serratia microhaemolytica]|uniref:glycerate kinase n=1 Tax=Serratia microhaemolytica TaxID=2675110 RepID=UPI000FDF3F23|nr:glycerate kinase [Serratia microhaemolytica]